MKRRKVHINQSDLTGLYTLSEDRINLETLLHLKRKAPD